MPHKVKETNGHTYCSKCGETYLGGSCDGDKHNHNYTLQKDGRIICIKCGYDKFSSRYDCEGAGKDHKYKSVRGTEFCVKCGDSRINSNYSCDGVGNNHSYDIDDKGNIKCTVCKSDRFRAGYKCERPARPTKYKTYDQTIADAIMIAQPHVPKIYAAVVYFKGGWSRTCLKGQVDYFKKRLQAMREQIKTEYDAIASKDSEFVANYLREAFSHEEDNRSKILMLTEIANIVTDKGQRDVIARALHYKTSLWDYMEFDKHLKQMTK